MKNSYLMHLKIIYTVSHKRETQNMPVSRGAKVEAGGAEPPLTLTTGNGIMHSTSTIRHERQHVTSHIISGGFTRYL